MSMADESAIADILAYHERTKHHFGRFARSLGYLDWKNQPDPFRRYSGAELLLLDEVPHEESELSFDALERPEAVEARRFDRSSLGQLFYDAFALSAWKEFRGNRWSLRCNPSSGNLHPTEAYLLLGPNSDFDENAGGLYHYSPFVHGLERRAELSVALWSKVVEPISEEVLFLGLTSIHWRESWKYGERAFRYCQLDVGHALAALSYAAAALGWRARIAEGVGDDELDRLLGVASQTGPEREQADLLVAIYPATSEGSEAVSAELGSWRLDREAVEQLSNLELQGRRNQLSERHHPWPAIDIAAKSSRRLASVRGGEGRGEGFRGASPRSVAGRDKPAREVMRTRRSAVAMDSGVWIDDEDFMRTLAALMPSARPPLSSLSWPAMIDVVLFAHRVRGIEPGLYYLARSAASQEGWESLRGQMDPDFLWEEVEGRPDGLPLYLLTEGDMRRTAELLSCQQSIAGDGAFALSMVARFESEIRRRGSWFYRRLFWEAGAIGQVLYLEAEAMGARATGIGCFFDDAIHELLGLKETKELQALYSLTVGGPEEDSRLRQLDAYFHRESALGSGEVG